MRSLSQLLVNISRTGPSGSIREGTIGILKLPYMVRCLYDYSDVPRVKADRRKEPHKVRDYGYTYNYHQLDIDPLPRMKGCRVPIKGEKPEKSRHGDRIRERRQFGIGVENDPVDPWCEEEALFGRNDYIDLLGDGSVHPAQLLYHVPAWLRGFPGQHRANELVRLIHYRNLYKDKMKRNSPRRWHQLCKRIQYLLSKLNYQKQDELHDERDLGLWDEDPDFFFKDKEWSRRSHMDPF